MPSELSAEIPDSLPAVKEEERFQAISTSVFEERVVRAFCQPILPRIPASVHPNTISLITHAIGWVTAALAVMSVVLPQPAKSLCLFAAAVGMAMSMVGDCLDGMHARGTDQCSKLGEMMDHWLDAIIVPLVTIGITFALQMDPWAIVAANVTAAMVYHGQLVLYHHTGEFIHPDTTSGVEAQFGVSIGYLAYGILLWFVARDAAWLDLAISVIAVLGVIVQMKCNWFYYVRFKPGLMRYHLIFVALCSGFGALYLLQIIDAYAFALTIVFLSFRICGSYVLFSIVKKPFAGNDWGVVGFICAIAMLDTLSGPIQLGQTTLQTILPYLACLYMLFRNVVDFANHFDVFRPTAA